MKKMNSKPSRTRASCCSLTLSAFALVILAGPAPAVASEKTFTTIDFPGADSSMAVGINARGDIVGVYGVVGMNHGFLLSRGEFTAIDFPDVTFTRADGINRDGDIVGAYRLGGTTGCSVSVSPPCRGYRLSGGEFTMIDGPDAIGTLAVGINARGDIVGSFTADQVVAHGYLLSGGEFTTIDFPDATVNIANGINRRGNIVGWYTAADDTTHGYLLSGGAFTPIDFPGATFTRADGINRRGDIVGWYRTVGTTQCPVTSLDCHGFLLSEGEFTSIDFPGATLTTSSGINARGDIVGRYVGADGRQHGYLLSGED